MPTTRWQLALRESQAPVTRALKSLGFKKIGNFYNRNVQDGLVQVVGVQSGQAASIFHGNYTVNLGVYVPCIAEIEGNAATGRCIKDAHCEVRSRLSDVANLGRDKWWPLDESAFQSGEVISDALLNHGVPFLDLYASKSAIIDRFNRDGSLPFHNSARSMLAVAIIQWSIGATNESLSMFDKACMEPSNNSRFSEYVRKVKQLCHV
jgi:Domain of unknown function (DUF4304)